MYYAHFDPQTVQHFRRCKNGAALQAVQKRCSTSSGAKTVQQCSTSSGAKTVQHFKRCKNGAALQAVQNARGAKRCRVQHFKRCKNGAALQAVQKRCSASSGAKTVQQCSTSSGAKTVQHFKRCKNGAAVQHFQRCKRCFDFFNTEGAGGVRWNFIFGDRQVLTCRKQRKKGV